MATLSPADGARRTRSPSPRAHPFVRAYSPQPPLANGGNDDDSDDGGCPLPSPLATPRKGGPVPFNHGGGLSIERGRSVRGPPRLPIPPPLATPPSVALPLPPIMVHERSQLPAPPRMWTRQPNDSTTRLSPVSPARGAPPRSPPAPPPVTEGPSPAPQSSLPLPPPQDERDQARTLGHSRSMYLRQRPTSTRPRSASYTSLGGAEVESGRSPMPWLLDDEAGSALPSPSSSRSSSRSSGWVAVSSQIETSRSTPLKDLFSPTALDADDQDDEDLTDRLPTLPLESPSLFGKGDADIAGTRSFGRKRGLFLGGILLRKKSSLPALRALIVSPLKAAAAQQQQPTWVTAADLDFATPHPSNTRPRFTAAATDSRCPSATSTRSTHERMPVVVPSPPPSSTRSLFTSLRRPSSQTSLAKRALETLHRRKSSASSTESLSSSASSRSTSTTTAGRVSEESVGPSPVSTTSSSTVRPIASRSSFTLRRCPSPSPPSSSSSHSSHLPTTPHASPATTSLPLSRTPTDRYPSFPNPSRSTSAKKLRQVLGVEAPGVSLAGGPSLLFPNSTATLSANATCGRETDQDVFNRQLRVSLLALTGRPEPILDQRRQQALPPLPSSPTLVPANGAGDAPVRDDTGPPQLHWKRETVDFSKTLLRLSTDEYDWSSAALAEEEPTPVAAKPQPMPTDCESSSQKFTRPVGPRVVIPAAAFTHVPYCASPSSDDIPTPTAALFSPEPITPHNTLGSPLRLASSFPPPPPPARKRSTLVTRRQSSIRQLGRSQSYKRTIVQSNTAPIVRSGLSAALAQDQPSSPIGRQRSLARRTSARRTVKKQKSGSNFKGIVKWGTRFAAPVMVAPPAAAPEERPARTPTAGAEVQDASASFTPPACPRPVVPRSADSYGSMVGSVGHEDANTPVNRSKTKRTTVFGLEARSVSPSPSL